jgi:hypothetical protein
MLTIAQAGILVHWISLEVANPQVGRIHF